MGSLSGGRETARRSLLTGSPDRSLDTAQKSKGFRLGIALHIIEHLTVWFERRNFTARPAAWQAFRAPACYDRGANPIHLPGEAGMKEEIRQRISARVHFLIEDGKVLCEAEWPETEGTLRAKWLTSCQAVLIELGEPAALWRQYAPPERTSADFTYPDCVALLGAMQSLYDALKYDYFIRLDDLVRADAFQSLIEQAESLLAKQYVVAAGVLGRAVLEEHLRNLCDRLGCMPGKQRPMLNDLIVALYTASHLNKLEMKQLDALAAAGNHCAHNEQPLLPAKEVKTLLEDVGAFVASHPLT